MRILVWPGLAGLVCIALFGCANSRQPESAASRDAATPSLEVVTREERRDLPAGTAALGVDNPHGDLRVRITDQPKIGYYALVQRLGQRPLDPVFDWRAQGDHLQLTVRYPGDERWPPDHGHRRGRVDLAVFVPAALALDLRTTDGFLQVRKARAAVRARTDSGSIEVSGAAELDLRSHSGAIAASQTSGEWRWPVELRTDSGRIAAAVPVYASITVDATTAGPIELEPGFPGTVAESGGQRRLRASFGNGERLFTARSNTGEVFLRAGITPSVLQPPDAAGD